METWKLLATFMLLIALVYSAQGISLTLDRKNWIPKDWQEEPMLEQLADQEEESLMKRSKARQFYGLMGRRSAAASRQAVPVQRRRDKGAVFIGLMGRRDAVRTDAVSDGQHAAALRRRITPEEDASSAADMMEESNQHLDLEEEWDKQQYY